MFVWSAFCSLNPRRLNRNDTPCVVQPGNSFTHESQRHYLVNLLFTFPFFVYFEHIVLYLLCHKAWPLCSHIAVRFSFLSYIGISFRYILCFHSTPGCLAVLMCRFHQFYQLLSWCWVATNLVCTLNTVFFLSYYFGLVFLNDLIIFSIYSAFFLSQYSFLSFTIDPILWNIFYCFLSDIKHFSPVFLFLSFFFNFLFLSSIVFMSPGVLVHSSFLKWFSL